jgi:hypothetical protein
MKLRLHLDLISITARKKSPDYSLAVTERKGDEELPKGVAKKRKRDSKNKGKQA